MAQHFCTEWDYHVNELLGIPFKYRGNDPSKGLDCWGLVCLFQEKLRGIPMAAHTEVYRERALLSNAIRYEVRWVRLHDDDAPRFGDILLFSPVDDIVHCGAVLDSQTMLHVMQGGFSMPEQFRNPLWLQRLKTPPFGVYRYMREHT